MRRYCLTFFISIKQDFKEKDVDVNGTEPDFIFEACSHPCCAFHSLVVKFFSSFSQTLFRFIRIALRRSTHRHSMKLKKQETKEM